MASDFTGKQIYQQDFDPTEYLETYYRAGKGAVIKDGFMEFVLRKLHEAFTIGGVKGDTLIDIGPGPAIYQELSACEAFKEIIAADFTDRNRQYLEKWLKNEPGMFDWTAAVKYVCEMEGHSDNIVGKQEKLRKTLKRIVKCDVTKSNPLEPLLLPQVDCVTSVGCLECACKDHDTYRKVLRNLSSLLKVGGHIIIVNILGSTYYLSGTKRFSLLNLDEAFIRKAITDAGFAIEDLEVLKRDFDKEMFDVIDYTSTLFYVARKVKEVK